MSINDWLDMMPDTVTIYPFVSRSASAQPVYSVTGTSYPARVEMRNQMTLDKQGREVMARGRVYLGSNAVIGNEDKIVLPTEYVPRNPPIIAVNIQPDESGNHHTVLFIG